ncbi:MAG: T9SS type A sorting domain-containing protein [Ignavibacteria bacterium]|nr:T9SS type A sorting domain-containing protein [Ignavibacteria bacterium]
MKKLLTFLLLVLLVSNTLWGQLSGTLTVGTGGNYATLGAAITDLNTVGVSGPVTFSLTDTAYTETATDLVIAPTLNPPSASASVTIKPAASIKPVVTISGCTATSGASQYSGFSINGAGNITIDGSNTVGGTTKDLTFVMNDATNGRNIIQLYGNCDTVTIKNTNLTFQTPMSTSTSTRGIYANGQATGAVDNFTVQNCSIGDATNTPFYAIGVTGSSSSSIYCTNVALKNNSLYGRIRPAYFFYVGSTGNTSEITGNTISTIGGLNASTTYSILMNTWGGTVNIQNNFIPTLTTNNTATSGIYGISGLTAQTGATCNIINNFIGGDLQVTGTGVPTVISWMYLQDNGTYNVYHNTINYPSIAAATERSCIHISGASIVANIKNNIIVNNTDAATAYCIWWKKTGTLTSDYNDLYVSGATANVGYMGTSVIPTLAAWKDSTLQDGNSVSKAVTFTSATDLHLVDPSLSDVDLAGIPVGVTTDIDGNLRDPLAPYKGADEGLRGGLKGDIYVGNPGTGPGATNPQFALLKDAFDYLNTATFSDNVNLYITSDITEPYTGSVGIGLAVNPDPYTLTIKPYTGVQPVVTFNYPSDLNSGPSGAFVIGIPGKGNVTWDSLRTTKNIVIDGSNTVGGTTRDLTLQSALTAQRNGMPIVIAGDVSNLTIKNCNILHKAQAVSTSNLFISAIMIRSRNYLSKDWVPNHITFDNNYISSNFDGVPQNAQALGTYQSGTPVPATFPNNITIKNNLLEGKRRVLALYQAGSMDIFNNEIILNQNIVANTSNEAVYAVSVMAGSVVNIYNNKISKLSSMSTVATSGNTGISIESNGTYNVYNNMINGFELTSANPTAYLTGIKNSSSTDTLNCFFNTIFMNDIADAGTGVVTYKGLSISNGVNDIKNNIIFSAESNFINYCYSREGTLGTLTSNYNDIFVQDNVNGRVGNWNSVAALTLADWQTASGQDANSKSVTVNFVSTSDLHLTGASDGDVNLIGTPLATVLTDIDGDTRHLTFPYMGADESNTPLPVELTSFTASAKGNVVELSWQTATEKNSSYFEVQRKSEKNDWVSVGKVSASGTTTERVKYSFTEKNVNGTAALYRLKMVDLDGSSSYSKEVEVKVDVPVNFELSQNYPNPFNPSTTIKYAVPVDSKVRLDIYSTLGELVVTLVNDLQTTGNYTVSFDASRFASGTYIYRLTANSTVITKKMLLIK